MSNIGKQTIICPGVLKPQGPIWEKKEQTLILYTGLNANENLNISLEKVQTKNKNIYVWKMTIVGPLAKQIIFIPDYYNLDVHANNTWKINLSLKENLNKKDKDKLKKEWGTLRQNITNALNGVTQGFEYLLTLKGIGYRAWLEGESLCLNVGFSHNLSWKIPSDIKVKINTPTEVSIFGTNKAKTSAWAHKIRLHKPSSKDIYKQAGISVEKKADS